MVKLQITLTDQEAELLSDKASSLGYDVTKYAKFVLAKEALQVLEGIPVMKPSSSMEKLIKQSIDEDIKGKAKTWPIK